MDKFPIWAILFCVAIHAFFVLETMPEIKAVTPEDYQAQIEKPTLTVPSKTGRP